MSTSSFVDAKEPKSQAREQSQNVNIMVFVNVEFSLLTETHASTKQLDPIDAHIAIADILDEHICYLPPIAIMDCPDRIFSHNIFIPCEGICFYEDGSFCDLEEVCKVIYDTCEEIVKYLDNLPISLESNVQVLINIVGYDFISDIVFGVASLVDENCPDDIEDESVRDFVYCLLEEFNTISESFLCEGWNVKVAMISILEHGIAFDIDKDLQNTVNLIDNSKKNDNEKLTEENDNNSNSDSQITLHGYVSKSDPDYAFSRSVQYYQMSKIINPPLYILDKLTGAEDIERDLLLNIYYSVKAHYEGDKKKSQDYLKKAGFSTIDYLHNRLEIISLAPVIGSIPSFVDGVIYVAQEDIAFFSDGQLNGVSWEKYRNQALWSFAGVVPFVKWGKYTKGFVTMGKSIKKIRLIDIYNKTFKTNLIKEIKSAGPRLSKAQKGLKSLESHRPPVGGNRRAKAKRKSWKNNKKKANNEVKSAEAANNNLQETAQRVGMNYEEINLLSHSNGLELLKQIYKSNLPLEELTQSLILQYINPYSTTRKKIKEIFPSGHKNENSK